MRTWIIGIIILALAVGSFLLLSQKKKKDGENQTYQFAEVTRGDIETTTSCTGTLNAVGTVEVGTQVSGTLARVYKDFNDRVRKGELLAVLDTTILKSAVEEAQSDLNQSQAQFDQAQADYNRALPLREKGFVAESELLPLKTAVDTRRAALVSSRARVQRAEQNLGYAYISAPISGTIIQRNIEQGQTVAASFSAPTLFVIAEDLSKMEIHALVDESDIGSIKTGQKTRFTVPAYYGKTFFGVVRQMRLQPQVVQNVVNYTVIIDAANEDNLLLPGMTATIDFIIDSREDVLMVASAALRFKPSNAVINQARAQRREARGGVGGEVRSPRPDRAEDLSSDGARWREEGSVLWSLSDKGQPIPHRVFTGLTNGQVTELLSNSQVDVGLKVISKSSEKQEPVKKQQTMMGPPPMAGFGRIR